LHTHFNDFVNRYRIAEFKRLLEQENHPAKMKEIAYKSGFNSYSPFYSAFCKETGISPLEYVEGKNEKRR
ncbi:MAG TPA: AraC family transcriptional regulator, partial [Bacteroidales bacterium]